MIKILNPKPLKEIEDLRQKGLYNAPFSVQENANLVKLKFDDSEIVKRLDEAEFSQSEFMVDTYEQLDKIKDRQDQAIIEVYETLLGGM
mgnify:CR=1 FL=1